jgi:hypothetical protein
MDIRDRIPGLVRNFSLHHLQTGYGAHPASCPMGAAGSLPGVILPECEVSHSFHVGLSFTSTSQGKEKRSQHSD